MSYNDPYRPAGFGGFGFFPPVIKNLLIINGVVFFLQIILGNIAIGGVPGEYYITQFFALNPIFGGDSSFHFMIWQLITYQFLHGGFGHIFFNMFALWMFGMEIEHLWGSKKFLIFYLSSGVVAGIAHILITPLLQGYSAPTIGASGAVYGVLIAFAMLFPNRSIYLYFLIPVKAKYLIAFFIIIEFLAVGESASGSNIAHLAHLGGALFGFVYIMLERRGGLDLNNLFKSSGGGKKFSSHSYRRPSRSWGDKQVEDAEYYDINDKSSENIEVTDKEIDEILDKISQSGYQNLTEREKKILFEASKRK